MPKKKKKDIKLTTLSDYLKDVGSNFDWLSSGIPNIDYLLGEGIPMGRLMEIYGPESSGKTTLSLYMMKAIQDAGGIFLYIDSECAAFIDRMLNTVGINSEKCFFQEEYEVQKIVNLMTDFIDTAPDNIPLGIVWDSVAASAATKEIDSDIEKNDYSRRAIIISRALREKLIGRIRGKKVCTIFLNQTRTDIGKYSPFGVAEYTPGGKAIKFHSSIRVKCSIVKKLQKTENGVKKTKGVITSLRTIKNKLAPPDRRIFIPIYFDKRGIKEHLCIIENLKELGCIRKDGGKYFWNRESFLKRDSRTFYEENKEGMLKELRNLII